MALGDPYATAAEYKDRVGKTNTADDATILAQLTAVSHFIDARCRRKDGFNQSAAAEARTYDINRSPSTGAAYTTDYLRLYLPHDVATVTGLAVKVDMNGDYDVADTGETLSINTDFWVGPSHAAVGADPQPFTYLDIHPSSTLISAWPIQRRAIEVTAKFGWPEVPEAVKELTIAITRQLRDLQEGGATAALQAIDAVITESRELNLLMLNVERAYKQGPSF